MGKRSGSQIRTSEHYTDQDPELSRLLAQVAGLSESDRQVAKRVLELLAAQNAKK